MPARSRRFSGCRRRSGVAVAATPPSPPRGPPRPSLPSPQMTSPPEIRGDPEPGAPLSCPARTENAREDVTCPNAHVAVRLLCSRSRKRARQVELAFVRILVSCECLGAQPISALAASPVFGPAQSRSSLETRARPAPLVRASRTSHSSRSSSSHAPAMAAMSAVSPVCLRAPAPSARKSRAGRMSSRVAAPAALRTSAVTGRRAQGMSVSAPPLSRRFRAYPRPERVSRGSHAARRATDRRPLGCYRARIPKKRLDTSGIA